MSPVPRQGLNPLYLMISVAPGSEPCSGEGASPWAQRGTPIRPGLCFRARTSPLPARPWQHPARGAELLGAPAPSLTVPFQACHGTHHTHNPPGSEAWVPPCPIHRSVRALRGGSAPRQGQKPPTPGASRSPPSPSPRPSPPSAGTSSPPSEGISRFPFGFGAHLGRGGAAGVSPASGLPAWPGLRLPRPPPYSRAAPGLRSQRRPPPPRQPARDPPPPPQSKSFVPPVRAADLGPFPLLPRVSPASPSRLTCYKASERQGPLLGPGERRKE